MIVETFAGEEYLDTDSTELGSMLVRNMGGKVLKFSGWKLTQSEVRELIAHLSAWVETNSLVIPEKEGGA